MASKAEAKQFAAEMLRLVPVGQSLQPHHDTRMGEAYDEVYAMLQVKQLATWDSSGEMPDEITPHFVVLMAYNKRNIVGISDTLYQRIQVDAGRDGETAVRHIRNAITPSYSTEDEATDY
jgi:hypothetical protein